MLIDKLLAKVGLCRLPPKAISKRVSALPSSNLEVRVLADKILQTIPGVAVVVKDPETLRIVRANQEACDWFGLQEAAMLGKTVFELVSDVPSAKLIDAADREASTQGFHEMEAWVLNRDRRRRLRSTRFLFKDEFSTTQYLVCMTSDVTDMHAAFVRAEDLERTTHSLLTGLPFPIMWLDRTHTIKGNNLSFASFSGLELAVNHSLLDVFPFVVAESMKQLCGEVEGQNQPMSRQMSVWRDQHSYEMVVHVCPLHNVYSQVTGTVVTLYDVTELVRGASMSSQVTMAFDLSTDPIMFVGKDRKVSYVNAALCAQTGYTKADLLGKDPSLFKTGAHDDTFYTDMWDTLNACRPWQSRITTRTKVGHTLIHSITILPILNGATPEPVAYLSIWHTDGEGNEQMFALDSNPRAADC